MEAREGVERTQASPAAAGAARDKLSRSVGAAPFIPARPRPSYRQDEANNECGGGQDESPDSHHATRRCSEYAVRFGVDPFASAHLHTNHPDDGSAGDEDQCDDRLVAGQGPKSPEGDGHCDGGGEP
jgi:hypothetical protein